MTPEQAVLALCEILKAVPDACEDEIYSLLERAGLSPSLADRTYKFAQVAWGRSFLGNLNLNITFSNEYVCFDANGDVTEAGRLSEEPSYAAAVQQGRNTAGGRGFANIALRAPEVHAVNNALNYGSTPENLSTTTTYLFLEVPTKAGIRNVQKLIAERTARMRESSRE